MIPLAPVEQLAKVLRRRVVADMPSLCRALSGRSSRSLFRDLARVDHLVSYTHAGRFFALREAASFDEDGLWLRRDVGFSRHGTLKDTAAVLVGDSAAGRTHAELEGRVRVRVHNALLELVRERRIRRETLGGVYVYAAAAAAHGAAQIAARRRLLAVPASAGPLASVVVVEVLVEVIHGARARGSPEEIAAGLAARGVAVTVADVERVLREHGIQKKGRRSRSRRSPR
jgi:hypothetical protein